MKDHDNGSMQDIVDASNWYCYENAPHSSSESENKDEGEAEELHPTHCPTHPCCLVVVSHCGYVEQFQDAVKKLQSDGLVLDTRVCAECDKGPSKY